MNVTERAAQANGRFDIDPQKHFHFTDGLCAVEMTLPKGYKAYSHTHSYSHFSFLTVGKVKVTTDTTETIYTAPALIVVAAGVVHEIEALEDVKWFCIHATNETDLSKIDEVLLGR